MTPGTAEKLSIGIVGVRRGRSFGAGIEASGISRVHAVCDIDEDALRQAAEGLGAAEMYTSYDDMLDSAKLDAVIVATPVDLHVPQSVQALGRGLHVLSEVPAAVSVEQCRDLVSACKAADAVYMMAENMNYTKPNVLVRALVEGGLFGEVYYAEGEYLHELKELNERTPWRRIWQTGVRGITYGTHSLGPILNWMSGDRIVRVSCEGSGSHYVDPRGDHYHDDTSVMLAKTANGGLIKVRVDMISDRPSGMCTYQLQGTKGAYESARRRGDVHRVWLTDLHEDRETWHELSELEADYLPDMWREPSGEARSAGHGGGDYFVVLDFTKAITGEAPCPIGVHEAMDITVPGLVSQQSIERDGEWLEVPDSRDW